MLLHPCHAHNICKTNMLCNTELTPDRHAHVRLGQNVCVPPWLAPADRCHIRDSDRDMKWIRREAV